MNGTMQAVMTAILDTMQAQMAAGHPVAAVYSATQDVLARAFQVSELQAASLTCLLADRLHTRMGIPSPLSAVEVSRIAAFAA